jgi:hypothetical protein
MRATFPTKSSIPALCSVPSIENIDAKEKVLDIATTSVGYSNPIELSDNIVSLKQNGLNVVASTSDNEEIYLKIEDSFIISEPSPDENVADNIVDADVKSVKSHSSTSTSENAEKTSSNVSAASLNLQTLTLKEGSRDEDFTSRIQITVHNWILRGNASSSATLVGLDQFFITFELHGFGYEYYAESSSIKYASNSAKIVLECANGIFNFDVFCYN